ncbi:MAG TPA: methylmalonyl-CoA mutase family protein, partial [Anaerolineales bacterium]|nr:methylmalonyl-CoA mutase family protein [Anaerolineales bacterium]
MTLLDQFNKWKETTLKKSLDKFKERKGRFETSAGIEVPRLAIPDGNEERGDLAPTVADENYVNKLGFPGEFPYTRGVQPTMYRSRFWTMRQYAGFSTAEESNKRYRYLLEQGQTGLSVAFDLPTQIGYDADDPIAQGEVGKVGVSISSIKDMEQLFDQIPLDKVSTSMTINAPAGVLLAMYIAVAKRQGADMRELRGTIQNDILKEYVARGTYIFPPAPSMRLITDIFQFCSKEVPYWNTISISGYHIREAGSTAVQEVAFTLANGIAYVEAALKAGLNVDDFAGQLSFFFNAHNNLLEEVAKFRAARRMWAKIMRERFKAQKPSSWQLRFHTQTAGSTLTAQQPENNVVRVTLQALSAVLGGTQSLHTNSMDEALWLPTEKSVRVALRTQQIIAHESGVADSIDPLAGSYL